MGVQRTWARTLPRTTATTINRASKWVDMTAEKCLGAARWIAAAADCRHAFYLSTEQTKGLTRGKRSNCKYELYKCERAAALSDSESAAAPEMKSGRQVHCATRHCCLYFYMFKRKRLHLLFTPEPLDGGAGNLVGAAGLLLPTNCFSRIWFIEQQSFHSSMASACSREAYHAAAFESGLSVYGRSDFGQLPMNKHRDEDVNLLSSIISLDFIFVICIWVKIILFEANCR